MLSNFEYDSATGLLLKQNYGNGDCINYSYDNLDRLSYKMYNGDGNRKLSYSYGRDGNIASSFDSATGEKTVFCYDLANRAVGQKTYVGSTLSSSLAYTYADKTNYLVGVKHKFALGEQTIGYRYGNLSVGEMPDQIYGVTWNGKEKIGYSYDGFGRITDKTVMPSLSKTLHNRYTYYDRESGNRTSTTVKSLETANGTYTYTYDAVGNILSINDGTYTVSYVYDGLNQLVRENDQRADTTTVYTYTNGNITGKKVYKYTLGNVGEEIKSSSYGYSNSEWRDLLTSFNGQAVTYDEIGNPLTFGSKSFEWCGRQLERITDGDNTYVYAYNTDGDRVSKTVNGVKTEYFYNGSILAGQKTGDETLIFMYDNNGDAFGFIYNGEEYYYIKNVQNDIVAIADKNGDIVANYYYDAWGNVTQITGNTALAQTNPLRYRSYYYDSETGYYHLKSRYYSPEVGRFLNADGIINANNDVLGNNLFVYCSNNPISFSDPSGCYMISIPAEGDGPVEIITGPGEPEIEYSKSGNTYTFKPKNIASNIGKAIAKTTGIALGDGLAKKHLLDQYVAQMKATYRTADNIVLQTYVPKNPSLVKAQKFSKTVGVVSAIVYVYDMAVNFKTYGGFTKDFGKAAVITTTIAVAGVAVGALIGCLNLPVFLGAALTIATGVLLTIEEDRWKKSWIGY